MAPDKLSRDPGHEGEEPAEGVRIIAAEELAEAAERTEAVRRRSPDEPGFKDRPPSPSGDARPAIRFPLPDSADPASLERPRPAPVEPPRAEGSAPDRPRTEVTPVSLGTDQPEPAALDDGPDIDLTAEATDAAPDERAAAPHGGAEPDPHDDGALLGFDEPVPVPDVEVPPGDPARPPAGDVVPTVFDDLGPSTVDEPPPGPEDRAEAGPDPTLHVDRADDAAPDTGPGSPGFRLPPIAFEIMGPDSPDAPGPDLDAVADDPDGRPELFDLSDDSDLGYRPPAEPAETAEADAASEPPARPAAADGPVLDLGPATGEHELPHWTEPPTGEVPRVVIGDAEADPDDEQRWASFAASGARWRGEHDTTDHGDLMADLAVPDDEPVAERLGALDQTDRLSDEAYLNFDDVDLDPRQRGRRGGRRGRGRSARTSDSPPLPDPLEALVSLDPPVPARPAPPDPTDTRPEPPAPTPAEEAPAADERPRPRRSARPSVLSTPPPPDDDPAAPRPRRRAAAQDGDAPVRTGGGRNVPQAAAVGLALAVVTLLFFRAGPAAAMVLVELIVVLAAVEFYGAVQRGGFRPATLLGLVSVAALPLAAYWKGEAAFPLVIAFAFVVGVLWYLLGVGGKSRPTANLGVTMVGIVWVGVLGAFAALILDVPAQGVSILLVAIVGTVAHDAGAFFVGRAMGRTPLSDISPGKTVEGLVGGVGSALVAVFVVAVLLGVGPFSSGQALVFGLVIAVVAPLGDLAESLFKRDLGLKDMGSILPEHGGILDRFDAMLFVLPAAYYAVRALGLAA